MKPTRAQNLIDIALIGALAMTAAYAQMPAPAAITTTDQAKEELAYTIGTQAYVYGYPWIYLPTLRWLWVTQPVNPQRVPYAAINRFYTRGRSPMPNTATAARPTTTPSIPWHGWTCENSRSSSRIPTWATATSRLEIASLDSDNFAYVGKRATGGKAGSFRHRRAGLEG